MPTELEHADLIIWTGTGTIVALLLLVFPRALRKISVSWKAAWDMVVGPQSPALRTSTQRRLGILILIITFVGAVIIMRG